VRALQLAGQELRADAVGAQLLGERRELGDGTPLADLAPGAIAAAFAVTWDSAAARTWNRHRSAVRTFTAWASGPGRGWIMGDLASLLERRPETRDRTRAIARPAVEALSDRRDLPPRGKTL
jgi:hypothetical protein